MLRETGVALSAAVAGEAAAWFLGGPFLAATAGAAIVAIALTVTYRPLSATGQVTALFAGGVSPRRIVGAVTGVLVLTAILEAGASLVLLPSPGTRTESAGYVLAALQPPLIASAVFAICARRRNREPWDFVFMLLFGYVASIVVLKTWSRLNGWAPGFYWLYVDAGLALADVALYRLLSSLR